MKHSKKYTGTAYGYIYELYNSFRGRAKQTRRLRKRERRIYKAKLINRGRGKPGPYSEL